MTVGATDIYPVDTVLPVHIVGYSIMKPPLNLPLKMAEWQKHRPISVGGNFG